MNNNHRFLLNEVLCPVQTAGSSFESIDTVQARKSGRCNFKQKMLEVESKEFKNIVDWCAKEKVGKTRELENELLCVVRERENSKSTLVRLPSKQLEINRLEYLKSCIEPLLFLTAYFNFSLNFWNCDK